jgi:predicted DNA-binding transcriptional regulator AlpA
MHLFVDSRPVTLDLDRLLADIDRLPADQLPDAIGALESVKARAWARLVRPESMEASPQDADQTVNVQDAARLLGMSPTWVYRHADTLPFTRRVGRRALRFSVAGIRRYLARRRPA